MPLGSYPVCGVVRVVFGVVCVVFGVVRVVFGVVRVVFGVVRVAHPSCFLCCVVFVICLSSSSVLRAQYCQCL